MITLKELYERVYSRVLSLKIEDKETYDYLKKKYGDVFVLNKMIDPTIEQKINSTIAKISEQNHFELRSPVYNFQLIPNDLIIIEIKIGTENKYFEVSSGENEGIEWKLF